MTTYRDGRVTAHFQDGYFRICFKINPPILSGDDRVLVCGPVNAAIDITYLRFWMTESRH